jgi:hypothetical protein
LTIDAAEGLEELVLEALLVVEPAVADAPVAELAVADGLPGRLESAGSVV